MFIKKFNKGIVYFLKMKWISIWKSNPPGMVLLLLSSAIALVMAIPILYVVYRSFFAGTDKWRRLIDGSIPGLLWNTISLTVIVMIFSVIIGVLLAWLIVRTDIPFKRTLKWLLALPLLVPPYVGAVTYIIFFGRSGWLQAAWTNNSFLSTLIGDYPVDIYSFWGVSFVLIMFTYPYVYLIVSASLKKMNRNYEEAAQSLGMNRFQIFRKVILPSLRPSIGAGAILVSLYVLSDFGAIAMMRYVTFTAAIYFQRTSFDTESAAVLSLVLIALTLIILWIESRSKKSNKYYQNSNSYRRPMVLKLGKWKWPATVFAIFIFTVSVVLPIMVLIYWSIIGIGMGAVNSRFFAYAFNSLRVATVVSVLCMLASMPVVYLKMRYPSVITRVIDRLSYAGYALPGVIVALGFVFVFNNFIPALYGTFYIVAIALIVRFLPQAMQSGESALSMLSPKIDEAARSLGYPPWKVMFKVVLPNMLPGVLAGGALVFVSSIKELPATLLLRPPGFDTLAIRIYVEASEAIYHLAAPAALLIIMVSIIPLKFMLDKY
ncbi:iron(III) transport system permease protein [Natranaerovirga hydrolytica]|uniref:Iron(III) transport system permease protein n=1 Tax=Natranaerovirga hydrolytica TaxID=680378 RepID=A0A4R1ML31_9FIRM|nr:iron ABC transporter permease [Natranaerovirga hydrolytica]TCK92770.1 iron(III) transport system permease protein [Natranaerovirga hydrolytica]